MTTDMQIQNQFSFSDVYQITKRSIADFLISFIHRKKYRTRRLFINDVQFDAVLRLGYNPNAILVTPNYLVLDYLVKGMYGEHHHYYVIGVNDDEKLFIQKTMIYDKDIVWLVEYRLSVTPRNIFGKVFYLDRDDIVYQLFNYDVDVVNENIKSIPIDGMHRYRVQGDLVLEIIASGDSSEQVYRDLIATSIREQIRNILRNIVFLRISEALAEKNISCQIREDHVVIDGIPKKPYSNRHDYAEKIDKYLNEAVYISDIARNHDDGVRIYAYIDRGIFDRNFCFATVRVDFDLELLNDFARMVVDQLDLPIDYRHVARGRHQIEYFGYPNRFTFKAQLPIDHEINSFIFNVNLDELYVARGLLHIKHPEHRAVTLEIVKDSVIRPLSTRTEIMYQARLNFYAIKRLH
jgi:hypothetical protein